MASFTFKTNDVPQEERKFAPLPDGYYLMHAVKSDIKATRNDGEYINFEFHVLDGDYANRRLWTNINIKNKNEEAVKIGLRMLQQLCVAAGLLEGIKENTEELHFIPVLGLVKRIKAGEDKHGVWRDEKNEIRGFKPEGSVQAPQMGRQKPQPVANKSAGWEDEAEMKMGDQRARTSQELPQEMKSKPIETAQEQAEAQMAKATNTPKQERGRTSRPWA